MLILNRKKEESIIIGNNDIRIKILSITGQQVRIGIEADADIPVHREEIFQAIRATEMDESSHSQ